MVLPKEFHIDCSGWPGAVVAEIDFRYTLTNGKRISTGIFMQPGTTPNHVQFILSDVLDTAGWRYRKVGKSILVIEGSKTSPIQSVVFKSKQWTPDVRMVILTPPKK